MWKKITQGWRDAFYADKVLFPSKNERAILYSSVVWGTLLLIYGGLRVILSSTPDVRGIVVVLVGICFGFMLPAVFWTARATRYIVKKEA